MNHEQSSMKTLTKAKRKTNVRRRRPATPKVNARKVKIGEDHLPRATGSLFGRVERLFRIDTSFERGLPTRFVPYILYFTIIGLFYIGNSHYAERMIRQTNRLEQEVEDLRANYTTLKASYMYESKQSQVAKRAKKLGLEESATPPLQDNRAH